MWGTLGRHSRKLPGDVNRVGGNVNDQKLKLKSNFGMDVLQ